MAVWCQPDVGRLDIAVDHRRCLLVQEFHRFRQLDAPADQCFPPRRSAPQCHRLQIVAMDHLHHDENRGAGLHAVVDRRKVGITQPGQHARLVPYLRGLLGRHSGYGFNSAGALQPQIRRGINRSHAALFDDIVDLVAPVEHSAKLKHMRAKYA
ncbi:MAG: hypothetical protein AVDCRST_MAG26-1355 [uncultured Chloroflexia bacterium]|uniref:Uncharacterized protein n=1 Tax=uncultured Chloroflexia bacterium TaxID=1672391 RepID=A0A6J4I299_9CHLR|nr:MAG: hypothetical protein AVDCRST_MAG26-1355 [uncultured Chloroflexia bacterium]